MTLARLALPTLLLASACAGLAEGAEGPFFGAGFGDGCRTAEARNASFSVEAYRDEALFDAEESYRAGWRSGWQQCQPQARPTARPEDLGQQPLGY